MPFDQVKERLRKHGFEFQEPVYELPKGEPVAETEFGGHLYQLYREPNFFGPAKEFAESRHYKGKGGRLVTIACAAQNAHLSQFLASVDIPGVWLGGDDQLQEGYWRWLAGPMAGRIFFRPQGSNEGMYSNWRPGEPNDADFREDCGVLLVDGWNDEPCEGITPRAILVEYGDEPIICDSVHSGTELNEGDTVPDVGHQDL